MWKYRFDKQVVLEIPEDLYELARKGAEMRGCTTLEFIIEALEMAIKEERERMRKTGYKVVLKRIKEILAERPEIGSSLLRAQLHNEGFIQSYLSLNQAEISRLMNRHVKERKVLYEDDKVKVEHEIPEKLTWFYLKEKGNWIVLGYMIKQQE